jgi:hypothetical protein
MTAVKLTVTSGVEGGGASTGANPFLLGITKPKSSIRLEDCTFETTFDSPFMLKLSALEGYFGEVCLRLQPEVVVPTPMNDLV